MINKGQSEISTPNISNKISKGLNIKGYLENDKQRYPLVSIITAVRNAKDDLESLFLHLENQTYNNIEQIIIDGGSDDDTRDVLKKYDKFLAAFQAMYYLTIVR